MTGEFGASGSFDIGSAFVPLTSPQGNAETFVVKMTQDHGLDESMDASDPPSATQPGSSGEPPKSSGFDEAAEAERQQDS